MLRRIKMEGSMNGGRFFGEFDKYFVPYERETRVLEILLAIIL